MRQMFSETRPITEAPTELSCRLKTFEQALTFITFIICCLFCCNQYGECWNIFSAELRHVSSKRIMYKPYPPHTDCSILLLKHEVSLNLQLSQTILNKEVKLKQPVFYQSPERFNSILRIIDYF